MLQGNRNILYLHSDDLLNGQSLNFGLPFLILDGKIAPGLTLVLPANEVGDLLILCLLDCRLVALVALAQTFVKKLVDRMIVQKVGFQILQCVPYCWTISTPREQ